MRTLVYGLALFLLASTSTAFATPAKDASVKKLLAVTHVRRLVQNITKQAETLIDKSARRALNGKPQNPKQAQAIARMEKTVLYTRQMIRDSSPQMKQIVDQFRTDMKAASE